MKNYNNFKIVQLTLLMISTIASLVFLLNGDFKQYVFSSKPATILFILVWFMMLMGYFFIVVDFHNISTQKHEYHNLYNVAYSDSNLGIANRFSCDTIIEKYADTTLPFTVTCVMIELSNLREINTMYGHAAGNTLLKSFSTILNKAASGICFVGRNGGNKFLAIFEECTQEKLDNFLNDVQKRVASHNQKENAPIVYSCGIASNMTERITQITQLISLADRRASNS